jgi:toxic protein SymE
MREKNNKKPGKRHLKVYPKYFQRASFKVVIFPEIRLVGKWVQDLGFNSGEIITVYQEKNKITITLSDQPSSATDK